jgi:hypothetical protein
MGLSPKQSGNDTAYSDLMAEQSFPVFPDIQKDLCFLCNRILIVALANF